MRARALVLFFVGCLGLAVRPPAAQSDPPAQTEAKVTLELKDVPLRQALQKLFQGTKQQLSVNADVPDTPIVVKISDVDFETAVRIITRLAGADYRREGERYVIQKRPGADESAIRRRNPPPEPPPGPPLSGKTITLDLERVPVREALGVLFQRANEKYRVEPDVPYTLVSIHVTNVDFIQVLQAVTRLGGATYRLRYDTYVIRRR